MSLARNGRGGKRDRAAFEALTLGAMLTYDHSTGAGDDTVNYYRPHFTANCDSRRGHSGMDVFEKALDSARVNWLSYAPDGSDVWDNPIAKRLKTAAGRAREGDVPRGAPGARRTFATKKSMVARADGQTCLQTRDYCRNDDGFLTTSSKLVVVDLTNMGDLKLGDAQYEFVKDYATAACSATAKEVVEMKRTQSIARRLLAHDVARRRRAAAEVKIDGDFNGLREQLCVDVGFGQAERDKIGYHGPGLPDDNPRCALLGHEDCPEHLAVMEAYRASKKRSNRGVDGLKKIFRDKLGPEGIKRVLSARFPRLREVPHVLDALVEKVHFDHVFSAACDHPMNAFLDFGPSTATSPTSATWRASRTTTVAVMVPCGEWLKICLTAMVRAVKVA
ncbi:hypothetical protein JL720_3532 [Aureococcus anophagefferens]|nr:hypothetical protein JL720_3532 [Aureococcus anophagefferens]